MIQMGGLSTFSPNAALKIKSFFNGGNCMVGWLVRCGVEDNFNVINHCALYVSHATSCHIDAKVSGVCRGGRGVAVVGGGGERC